MPENGCVLIVFDFRARSFSFQEKKEKKEKEESSGKIFSLSTRVFSKR